MRLKPEVAPGARFAAPGTTNGGFSSLGTYTNVAPDAVIAVIDVTVTLVAAALPVLDTAIDKFPVPATRDCKAKDRAGAGTLDAKVISSV